MVAAAVQRGRSSLRILTGGTQTIRYEPRGAAQRVLECRDFEVLNEGPVGTGKSYALLWKLHLCALKYPGMKGLLLRKTQTSLTGSAIATYTQKILRTGQYGVRPFSGNIEEPASFRYPNGSRLVVGGLDKPEKVMSTEYDLAALFEATDATEDDVEKVTTRLRNYVMPYQQLLMDCNPGAPTHWLNRRANEGTTTRLLSRHPDNPLLWDAAEDAWTDHGREYMARLDTLSGVRRLRLRDGLWVAAEGQVYEGWDPALHLVDRFDIPPSWPRIWVVDFGFVHPFVWQAWAIDPDGNAYRYRELYQTRRLVEDHVTTIMAATKDEPKPTKIITDHDAEDRATFARKSGYATMPANKNVSAGIQAVAERLRPQANGKPRLRYLRDSGIVSDHTLADAALPTCTEDEYPSYVWNTAQGRGKGEEPLKESDHGMDCTRYLVADLDLGGAPAAAPVGIAQRSKWQ